MAREYAEAFLPLWYNALDEEIGLFIRTDNQQGLVATLYFARDGAADPALAELSVFKVGTDTVYIAKRSTDIPE
jgi:hypothetical protein